MQTQNMSRNSEIKGIFQCLLQDPETVTRGERVNIIQHPRGRLKELSLHDNKVTYVYDKVIRYTTDTEPGSSGSPVFNNQWDLVALHHAGWAEPDGGATNEGVRMTEIVAYLREKQSRESSSALEDLIDTVGETSPPVVSTIGKTDTAQRVPSYKKAAAKGLTINIEADINELTIRLR